MLFFSIFAKFIGIPFDSPKYRGTRELPFIPMEKEIDQQVINFESDQFHVRTAKTLKEACKLVEAGFEYVTDLENSKIFRKRK